jgi:hypothetical protein
VTEPVHALGVLFWRKELIPARQNALTRLHHRAAVVKTKSMSRLESLEGIIAAGGSSKDLAAEMAITRRKSSVEVPQHHSQSSGDVFRRHSSLGAFSASLSLSLSLSLPSPLAPLPEA